MGMQRGIDSGGTEEYEDSYGDDYEDEEAFSPDSAGISSRGLGGVMHEDNLISGDMVVALYDYEAQDEDEFDIKVGDIMTIAGMDVDDEGWYLAEMDGRQGFIPWNFVQKVQAEPTPALGEVVLPADLHSELWGFESQRKNVQLTILSAQGLDARHDGCPYVQVHVAGQADSSFRTHAVQADGRAWQQPCTSLALQPGTSLRLSVYREVPSQPDKFLGSAELVLLDPEMAWHGELCLVDEMGVMQGGLLSVAMVPGLPIDETFHPRAPIRQSLIDRQSMTPETERNTPQSRSLMPERAQTLSPSLSEIKRKACQIIEEATRDGRLKEALRQIPKSASSVQKEQSSMARASEVKPQACAELLAAAQNGDLEKELAQQDSMARAGDIKRQARAMLLQATQDGHLQKALAQIPKKTCSMARAGDMKRQARAMLLQAAQDGHLQKALTQIPKKTCSMARAGDIKRQARAMLLQAAQDGHLQKALTQIPKKTCSEASLARAEDARRLARALLNKVFLATAESSQEAAVVPVSPIMSAPDSAPDEVAADAFQEVSDELVPPIAFSARHEVARESPQHELAAELTPTEQPSEGHLEAFFAVPRRPLGPPPASRRLPPARKFVDPDAGFHEDQRRLRSKHINNLQQQRLQNLHAQVPAQGSPETSVLSASSEMGPEWYQDRMLEHFQRRRHLRGPGAAAVFEPSQPDPHTIPRTTSRPSKQHSPEVAPSPFLVKPPTKQRGNGMHLARPQPRALKRAGVPPHIRSWEAPPKENRPEAFPEFSEDVDMNGVAALYGVYTALVCSRRLEDQRWPFAQNSTEVAMDSIMSTDSRANRSPSKQQDSSKNFRQRSPGLAAFASRVNPWHWPRDGGVPPMDTAVVALLKGQPPPTKVSREQTLAARQALRLPVVQRTRQIPKWPDAAAKSSPRKSSDRPYWLRGAGPKPSPGFK